MAGESGALAHDNSAPKLVPAAAYVRMSTERQCYSAENQLEAIEVYAAARGLEVTVVYSDLGRSGLTLEKRPGLQQLLRDVAAGGAPFQALLVYDVSRWGRFQDPDDAAACEVTCKHAGVAVHYCAEQFENDGSVASSIIKALKRVMAGEYSRELSEKTFLGQANMARRGFRTGGRAGFGFRRAVIGADGQLKGILEQGEQKFLGNDRVVLTLGPPAEVRAVRRIYRLFFRGVTEKHIARILQSERVASAEGRPWTSHMVREVLRNEKYTGRIVWGRWSQKLGSTQTRVPPDRWIRSEARWPRIIPVSWFDRAQRIKAERQARMTEEELLACLRALLAEEGCLTAPSIKRATGLTRGRIRYLLGGAFKAYEKLGYRVGLQNPYCAVSRRWRHLEEQTYAELFRHLSDLGFPCVYDETTRLLHVADRLTIFVWTIGGFQLNSGAQGWAYQRRGRVVGDYTVLRRHNAGAKELRDYYILPNELLARDTISFSENTPSRYDQYRSDTLDPLYARVLDRIVSPTAHDT